MLIKLLGSSIKLDWKIAILTISSTLLIVLDSYHSFLSSHAWESLLLYFAVPFLIIVLLFRESLADYGFTLGDWKAGFVITTLSILFLIPILWLVNTKSSGMQMYYSGQLNIQLFGYIFLDLFGWEFLFRGFLLFGYSRKFGPESLWLQAVPFALAHVGKPEIETLSTIFGGFVFGWVAWRTKSFIYPLLIHCFVWLFTVSVTSGAL